MKDKGQLQAGRESAERGKTLGAKTEHERAYLTAVRKLYSNYETTSQQERLIAYRDGMQEVAAKYPEDHEAQIFCALAITTSEDPADKTHAGRLKAGAILEELFAEEPSHTFTRTGYWQESIDSNIEAAAAARREGQSAEELHATLRCRLV